MAYENRMWDSNENESYVVVYSVFLFKLHSFIQNKKSQNIDMKWNFHIGAFI